MQPIEMNFLSGAETQKRRKKKNSNRGKTFKMRSIDKYLLQCSIWIFYGFGRRTINLNIYLNAKHIFSTSNILQFSIL